MFKQLVSSTLKGMAWGIGLSIGIALTSVFAVTITSVFNSNGNLTAGMLNELKTALVALPNWTKGTTTTDAVYTDGNVGIGTTAPSALLSVAGKLQVNGADGRLSLQRTTGPNYVDFNDNQSLYFRSISPTDTNATTRMVIDNGTGNVGIGTTTSSSKLSLYGSEGSPATTGTTQAGIMRFEGAANNVLDIGKLSAPPYTSWLQSADRTNLATNYPLALQPNGGGVAIGTNDVTVGHQLDVHLNVTTQAYFKGFILLI